MVSKAAFVLLFAGLLLAGYLAYTWFLPPGTPILPPPQNATATPASPNATASVSVSASATASAAPSASPTPTPTPIALPRITKVNAAVNGTTANITWESSLPGYSAVEYGPTEPPGEKASVEETRSVHSLLLKDLKYNTKYYYRAGACVPGGCNYSALYFFTTPKRTCPAGMSYFEKNDFCMDRFEASRDPLSRLPVSASGKPPWTSVSYDEASAACASTGKRLCTSEEFAAACNIDGEKLGLIGGSCQVEGTKPNKTGETDCTSREGVHDLIGNVEEWVSDLANESTPTRSGLVNTDKNVLALGPDYVFPLSTDASTQKYGSDYYQNLQPTTDFLKGKGITRGGDYASAGQAGCYAYRVGVLLDTKTEKLGFRCCS